MSRDAKGRYLPGDGHKARGAGHGGPARGPGLFGARAGSTPQPKFTRENQPPGDHKSVGKMDAKEYKQKLEDRRAKVLELRDKAIEAGLASNDPYVIMAANKVADAIENRLDGAPKQNMEIVRKDERTAEQIERDVKAKMAALGMSDGLSSPSRH